MTLFESIWKTSCSLPAFPSLEQDTKTDVLIIGGGLAGILTAFALEQAGVDYLLIEADCICGGVTGNTTAKLTAQHGLIYNKLIQEFDADTARLYWEVNEAALERYRLLCQKFPCDFEEKDNYVYSTGRTDSLEQEFKALQRLGIPANFVKDINLPFTTTGAIQVKRQAQFHPLKFVSAIARGLNIREHTKALEFVGNTVKTNHGSIQAAHIIAATHFPLLNKHGAYFLKMYQERSYVLALEHGPEVKGMYLDAEKGGLSLRNYGPLLLLGGGSHRTGKPGKGWAPLEAAAKQYYPSSRVAARWATQDCMTLDGMPYIGHYSRSTADLYVATGFNKWGMTSSMVSAMLLCDMVQGKENPYAPVFSPSRTILRPQLMANLLESAAGLITPTRPRCPHMGCALKWNPQEHSWDCPCHGSRFSEDGTLLNNPATGNMNTNSRK